MLDRPPHLKGILRRQRLTVRLPVPNELLFQYFSDNVSEIQNNVGVFRAMSAKDSEGHDVHLEIRGLGYRITRAIPGHEGTFDVMESGFVPLNTSSDAVYATPAPSSQAPRHASPPSDNGHP